MYIPSCRLHIAKYLHYRYGNLPFIRHFELRDNQHGRIYAQNQEHLSIIFRNETNETVLLMESLLLMTLNNLISSHLLTDAELLDCVSVVDIFNSTQRKYCSYNVKYGDILHLFSNSYFTYESSNLTVLKYFIFHSLHVSFASLSVNITYRLHLLLAIVPRCQISGLILNTLSPTRTQTSIQSCRSGIAFEVPFCAWPTAQPNIDWPIAASAHLRDAFYGRLPKES